MSYQTFHTARASDGWESWARVLAGIHSHFVRFSLRPPTVLSSRKKAINSKGLCSALRYGSLEAEGEEQWAPLLLGIFSGPNKTKLSFE